MLLTAISSVADELERARLTATGIPSLVRCSLSGVALRQESGANWKLIVQKDGRMLPFSESKEASAELEPLYQVDPEKVDLACNNSTNRGKGVLYFCKKSGG